MCLGVPWEVCIGCSHGFGSWFKSTRSTSICVASSSKSASKQGEYHQNLLVRFRQMLDVVNHLQMPSSIWVWVCVFSLCIFTDHLFRNDKAGKSWKPKVSCGKTLLRSSYNQYQDQPLGLRRSIHSIDRMPVTRLWIGTTIQFHRLVPCRMATVLARRHSWPITTLYGIKDQRWHSRHW